MVDSKRIFGDHAQLYRKAGFWPRPVRPGTKACPLRKWNIPDPERKLGELDGWLESHDNWGLGLS